MLICGLLAAASGVAVAGEAERAADAEMEEGVRAAKRGYWLEALNRFERANALTPDDQRVLNNLAVALEAVGRFDEAREVYQKAVAGPWQDRRLRRNVERFEKFYEKNVARTAPAEDDDDGSDEGGEHAED
jgi:Flp pilus assembly protein TadD